MKEYNGTLEKIKEIFVGIDIHKKSWYVKVLTKEAELFSGSLPGRWEALRSLLERYEGSNVKAVYEAGYFGFCLHDHLVNWGADCIVTPEFNTAGIREPGQDRSQRQQEVGASFSKGNAQAGLGAE